MCWCHKYDITINRADEVMIRRNDKGEDEPCYVFSPDAIMWMYNRIRNGVGGEVKYWEDEGYIHTDISEDWDGKG